MSRVLIACLILVAAPAFADDKKPEPKGEPVSGKVSYKGQPLSAGTVTFVSKDGKVTVAAPLDTDGGYKATIPAGEYRVAVSTAAVKKDDPKKYVAIPAKYGDPATSGLTYEVKAGKQTFNIELTN